MTTQSRQWINPQLQAPNVLEIDLSPEVLAPLVELVPQFRGLGGNQTTATLDNGLSFHVTCPRKWNSDIRWVTQYDEPTYRYFERVFDDLGIAAHVADKVETDREIVLYTSMLVCRSHCTEPKFHRDWTDLDNRAFTLLTPLSDNIGDFDLVYRSFRGEPLTYPYRARRGILFGDHFWHSTAPGQTDEPVVLLAFQFGTDRMEYYPQILKSAYQGAFHRRPDGAFVRDGKVVG